MLSMARNDDLPQFMYLDFDQKPRSQYLEHMFEDIFYGRELNEVFRQNFAEYCEAFFDVSQDEVPSAIFDDYDAALRFVSKFGMVSIVPIDPEYLEDKDFAHCEFQSALALRGEYRLPYGDRCDNGLTVAPDKHRAVLLAFIEVMREITIIHIEQSTPMKH